MSKKKYYAIRKGHKIGVVDTWDECKELVNGFSGAEYKSFPNIEDAYNFIGVHPLENNTPIKSIKEVPINKTTKKATVKGVRSTANVKIVPSYIEPSEMLHDYDVIGFVDGSYDKNTKTFGSGIALLYKDGSRVDHKYAGYDKWDQWNIVGELESCKYLLSLAKEQGLKKVCIYHDLVNIAHWASGYFQAKNDYTKDYVRVIEEFSSIMEITFVKVPAHSGFELNECADKLAKEAIEDFLQQ